METLRSPLNLPLASKSTPSAGVNNSVPEDEISISTLRQPYASGTLYVKSFLNRWHRLHVELKNNYINISAYKGALVNRTFKLLPNTVSEESSLRHFCFSLSTPGKDTIYLAAENVASKESWLEMIHTSLSLVRLADRKLREKDRTNIYNQQMNEYINRPIIYIKCIRARNLCPKDTNGLSDPYVKITLGSSTVRTTTRKMELNPEWGMVFPFDWDISMRFAHIEVWDEDYSNADDFMGCVIIPVFTMKDGDTSLKWYPLGKRSHRSIVSGAIQLEISCVGCPDTEKLSWLFFKEVQMLAEFTVSQHTITTSEDISKEESSVLNSFPFRLPSIECETLEDIAFNIHLLNFVNGKRVSSPGLLLLTSHRLIFITLKRILYRDSENRFRAEPPDLSTFVLISSITSAHLTNDHDGSNIYFEAIRLICSDNRVLSFLFKDDSLLIGGQDGSYLNKTIEAIFRRNDNSSRKKSIINDMSLANQALNTRIGELTKEFENLPPEVTTEASDSTKIVASVKAKQTGFVDSEINLEDLSNLAAAWLRLVRGPQASAIEAVDAVEGPPAHRIHFRLRNRKCNRWVERYQALTELYPLFSSLRAACELPLKSPPIKYLEIMKRIIPEVDVTTQSLATKSVLNDEIEVGSESIASSHVPLGFTTDSDSFQASMTIPSPGLAEMNSSSISALCDKARQFPLVRQLFSSFFREQRIAWDLYRPEGEFFRIGIPNDYWRLTDINSNYELCSSYPALLAVPAAIPDDILVESAKFRSKGRIPTLCWIHPTNKCSISRCSQPLIGITNSRSTGDELLVANMSSASYEGEDRSYVIIDARPLLNAKANQAVGKGVESDKSYGDVCVSFMDIANIHAVRKSLEMLEDVLEDESNFARSLEASKWLTNIRKILLAAGRIAHLVEYERFSALIHCSDGWDRTTQLTSLSMLFLDGFYRTFEGFMILVEKEWLSFGHKFLDRLGWSMAGFKDEERSPIFLQFLDCVFQCITQNPNAYEFNEKFLIFLAENHNSSLFGNFMFNCQRDRNEFKPWHSSLSIWSPLLANKSQYCNENFRPLVGAVIPIISRTRIVFWAGWFLRWYDKVWSCAWLEQMHIDVKRGAGGNKVATWAEDTSASSCAKCEASFSIFRRRHHCRSCGLIYCDNCSHQSRVIPSISSWKPVRCCDDCAQVIDLDQMESTSASANSSFRRKNTEDII